MCSKIREFFWPVLEKLSAEEKEEDKVAETAAVKDIKNTDWSVEKTLATGEAHRISSEEEGRVKTAESKATNLLLFIGALIPLLIYLETAAFDATAKMALVLPSLLIIALAVAYLVKASLWAFRTIDIGNYHRVYSSDLVKIWSDANRVRNGLIEETLIATRLNQETINSKVTALKMTHAFLLRAIVSLSALVLLQVLFKTWDILKQPMTEMINKWIC